MDNPDEHVVVADGVQRAFDDDHGVHDLDLRVPRGVVLGLIGPSGAGKTTAVRLLLGVDAPDAGRIQVLGKDPRTFRSRDRSRIGYLPQSTVLYPQLTLRHNLNFVASLYGMPWRARLWPKRRSGRAARRRIDEILDLVGLAESQHVRLADASGGEQRRLALAGALVHDPELLVLDEPTAGIDPLLRRGLWDEFARLRDSGRTLIVTTQYVDEAANCDLVAMLVDGRILRVDTPDGLRRAAFGNDPDAAERTFDDVFVALVEGHRNGTGSKEGHGDA